MIFIEICGSNTLIKFSVFARNGNQMIFFAKVCNIETKNEICTTWKVSVFEVFLDSIFPHLEIRSISPYSAWIRENTNQKKSEYTFHVVMTNIALFSTNQIRDIFYSSGNDVYGVKIGKKGWFPYKLCTTGS